MESLEKGLFLSLNSRKDLHIKSKGKQVKRLPLIDEIVMLRDEHLPRTSWKLGKIEKLVRSKDGEIRSVYLNNAKVLR